MCDSCQSGVQDLSELNTTKTSMFRNSSVPTKNAIAVFDATCIVLDLKHFSFPTLFPSSLCSELNWILDSLYDRPIPTLFLFLSKPILIVGARFACTAFRFLFWCFYFRWYKYCSCLDNNIRH